MRRKLLCLGITLALVFTGLPLLATPVMAAATINVPTDYPTIQAAINAATAGDTIIVAAGTYVEQVVINKDLTLLGIGNPMIQAPASPANYAFLEGAGNRWEPVVLAFGGIADASFNITGAVQVTVNISGITVDGTSRIPSPTSRRAVGILYRNVVGGVTDSTVQNMGYSTSSINSWGIMAYGNSNVTFHGNTVSGYAKGGFVVNGYPLNLSWPKPNAVIDGNTVTGPPYDLAMTLAPNGIQIGWGATGHVINNTVTNNGYPGTDWGGTGILIMSSPDVIVEGNTVTGNDYGISPAGYVGYGGHYATGTIIRNNMVKGNREGIFISLRAVDTLVQNNTIKNNGYGVTIDLGAGTGNMFHFNNIVGNDKGMLNNSSLLIDAKNKWWGNPRGPSTPADEKNPAGKSKGKGDSVSANVTYDPWLLKPVVPVGQP